MLPICPACATTRQPCTGPPQKPPSAAAALRPDLQTHEIRRTVSGREWFCRPRPRDVIYFIRLHEEDGGHLLALRISQLKPDDSVGCVRRSLPARTSDGRLSAFATGDHSEQEPKPRVSRATASRCTHRGAPCLLGAGGGEDHLRGVVHESRTVESAVQSSNFESRSCQQVFQFEAEEIAHGEGLDDGASV